MSGPSMAVATKLPPYAQPAQARVQQNPNVDTEPRIKRLEATSNEAAISLIVSILTFGIFFDYMSKSLKGPLRSSSGLDQRIALLVPLMADKATVATTSFVAGALAATEILRTSAPLLSRIRVPEIVDCAVITIAGLAALAFSLNDTIDYVNVISLAAIGATCIKEVVSGGLPKTKLVALLAFSLYAGDRKSVV